MRPEDFDFELPQHQIAQRPTERRGQSRLLVLEQPLVHARAEALPAALDRLAPGALVVVNDSKVVPARVQLARASGSTLEALVCEPHPWERGAEIHAWVRGARKLREGEALQVGAATLRYRGRAQRDERRCVFELSEGDLLAELRARGEVPLPPYIRRPHGELGFDRDRYQTVYARHEGSIAAPTAGLHLDAGVLSRLDMVPLTRDHRVGSESYSLSASSAEAITAARGDGRPILAVGTTVTRALESIAIAHDGAVVEGAGETNLVITPGHPFAVVDALLTNFHLPRSSLLMLVCAFGGRERVLEAYRAAVAEGYRFYSYGDCMLLDRAEGAAS
jgi:S-adenosylmethionine:tRNA ribosyltransferase-isomerase